MQETWVRSLGWEDPQEKGKAAQPVFWPGEFHGLYSPWGHKESVATKRLSLLLFRHLQIKQGNYKILNKTHDYETNFRLKDVVSNSLRWTVAYQAPPSMGFSRQEY